MEIIYMIRNKVTDKKYVGRTSNWAQRWSQHKSLLRSGNHHCSELQNDWNELGEESFVYERLTKIKGTNSGEQEAAWMAHFYQQDENCLYNRCGGLKYALLRGLTPDVISDPVRLF